MNDDDWKIEIPSKLREQLTCLGYKMQEVADVAMIVQERVLKCPTRNEVFTLLDHKIDVSFSSKVESEVGAFIKSTQTSIDALKALLNDNINTIGSNIDSIRDSSKKISELENEFSKMQKETSNLTTLAEAVSTESKRKIDALQLEQTEMQKVLTGISTNLTGVKNEMASMTDQQSAIRDSFDDLKLVYQKDADQLATTLRGIYTEVEGAIAKVPSIISEAQTSAEQSITALIQQDIERREHDVNALNSTVQLIHSAISRIESAHSVLITSFEEMKSSAIADMQRMITNTSEELQQYISDTFLEFTSLKDQVTESIKEQKSALDELATFSTMFRQADLLWKQSLENTQKEVHEMFIGIKQNIEQDSVKIRDALNTSITKATQAHQLLQDTNNVWNTEWKDRELIVDETLTRLHRLLYEVDEAVANETNSRASEFDVLRDVMERAFCTLHHQIDLKAGADYVRRALWTKVDKLDI